MPSTIYISIFILLLAIILMTSSTQKTAERELKMVIFSKDKTKFAEYNRLMVTRSYGGGKDKKYALVGNVNHYADTLDQFATQEEAVAKLEEIFSAYQNGETTFVL